MIIFPAIDILEGKCVRLLQGRPDKRHVYADEPSDMAKQWQAGGAGILHVVDLDGALSGEPKNLSAVERIVSAVNIPVQLGGGLRSMDSLDKAFSFGVNRVVLGTTLVETPDFVREACAKYPGRVVAGIDAREGWVSVRGWQQDTKTKATDMARKLESLGISCVIYTDISVDGTQKGINLWGVQELAESIDIPVIASGGVRSGIDVAKSLALGATYAGAALPFLGPATRDSGEVVKALKAFIRGIRISMLLTGCESLQDLRGSPLIVLGRTKDWLEQRGFDTKKFSIYRELAR